MREVASDWGDRYFCPRSHLRSRYKVNTKSVVLNTELGRSSVRMKVLLKIQTGEHDDET